MIFVYLSRAHKLENNCYNKFMITKNMDYCDQLFSSFNKF